MNINLDFDLLVYGVMLGTLGVLAHRLAPDFGYAILITGLAGGVLAVFWGVLGLRGFRRRIWPIATLIGVDIGLLVQAVKVWLAIKGGIESLQPAAMILTVLLVCGIAELISFVRAGWRGQPPDRASA